MLWYKAWRESKIRFLISAAAIAGHCLTYVLFQHFLYPGVASEAPGVHNYLQYIVWTVFGGGTRGLMQLSCLLLGLGGLQRDRKQGTLGFTLALPVGRPRLAVTRAFVGVIQIMLLAVLPALLVPPASALVHQSLPLSYTLPYVPLWILGGLVTFSVTFLCSVVFNHEYVSLVVGYVSYIFFLAMARYPRLAPYPLHTADFMSGRLGHMRNPHTDLWTGVFPVTIAVGYAAAAMAVVSLSTYITTRQDL